MTIYEQYEYYHHNKKLIMNIKYLVHLLCQKNQPLNEITIFSYVPLIKKFFLLFGFQCRLGIHFFQMKRSIIEEIKSFSVA